MILKRITKDNEIKNIYESSNILSSTYNTTTNDLIIIFKNGGQYKYNKVDIKDYTRFEIAESQGKVFNSNIKKYSFTKLDNVDVEEIKNEIEDDRKSVKKQTLDNLILNMRILIELYDGNQSITDSDVERIHLIIKEYKEI